ncbi:Queuine tRNA-ribosyltransferase [anaerobic digester metagenome]
MIHLQSSMKLQKIKSFAEPDGDLLSYNFDLNYLELYDSKLKFNVFDYDKELFSRRGKALINDKKIQTPALWLGHVMGGTPHPWKFLNINTVIVNAADILRTKTNTTSACEKGIHKHLNFDGAILMDSGGFLFQKRDEIDIDPISIIELYEKSKPDLGVILDHPFNPSETNKANQKRWSKTLENTRIMFENIGKVDLMPVIHGYNFKELKSACKDVKKIIDEPSMIGVGSLVPLLFRTNGTKRFNDPIKFVIDAIRIVRQEFPNSFLHAFGVGSSKTMHLMYSLGVDSLDSTGWRLKAAYGIIQLPGVGDRHPISRNNRRAFLNEPEKKILKQCKCPSCNKLSINTRLKLLNDEFKARAIHNAHVFVNEQNKFQEQIKIGKTKEFTRKRLNSGIFPKAFDYIVEKKNSIN